MTSPSDPIRNAAITDGTITAAAKGTSPLVIRGSAEADGSGDGLCGCTERCKDRDNCEYETGPRGHNNGDDEDEHIGPYNGGNLHARSVEDFFQVGCVMFLLGIGAIFVAVVLAMLGVIK